MPKIYLVGLTGGPFGGKSTILSRLEKRLQNNDFGLITIKEAYRSLHQSGQIKVPSKVTRRWRIKLQQKLFSEQLKNENAALEKAKKTPRDTVIIITDRTLVGAVKYLDLVYSEFRKIPGALPSLKACQNRYDIVFHLQTLAFSNQPHFSDGIRLDTPEEAKEIDTRILRAWKKHKNFFLLPAQMSEKDKIKFCEREIIRFINLANKNLK